MSWDYADLNAWKDIAPIGLTGTHQSPVELAEKTERIHSCKSPIHFINYHEEPLDITVKNTGQTIQLTGHWKRCHPFICGSSLETTDSYNFLNAHIHWGTQDFNGTEHSVNNKKFAAELHIIHMNSKYKIIEHALKMNDGFAAMGILFDVNDDVCPNPGMDNLVSATDELQEPKTRTKIDSFDLSSFLPEEPVQAVYAYDGSLTTPPLTENVRWVVLTEVLHINTRIMQKLRHVTLEKKVRSNVRPLQPGNDRVIKIYEAGRGLYKPAL